MTWICIKWLNFVSTYSIFWISFWKFVESFNNIYCINLWEPILENLNCCWYFNISLCFFYIRTVTVTARDVSGVMDVVYLSIGSKPPFFCRWMFAAQIGIMFGSFWSSASPSKVSGSRTGARACSEPMFVVAISKSLLSDAPLHLQITI
jgi:hypothetical protein